MRLPTDKVIDMGGLTPKPYISFVSTYECIRVIFLATDLGLKDSVELCHKFVADNGIITGMYLSEIKDTEKSA